jgi:sec-independent protein translocase protein TatB
VFDIGFAELLLIGVVGLLVVGPEQLPGAVRTVLAWVNRFRRSFDQIRTEVRRELHNDEVLQKLKAESQQLEQQVRDTAHSVEQEIQALGNEASESLQDASSTTDSPSATSAADANESGDKSSKPA